VAPGGSVAVATSGIAACIFDNATTVNDIAVQSAYPVNECHDSGYSSPSQFATSTQIVGIIQTAVASGSAASVDFVGPAVFTPLVSSTNAWTGSNTYGLQPVNVGLLNSWDVDVLTRYGNSTSLSQCLNDASLYALGINGWTCDMRGLAKRAPGQYLGSAPIEVGGFHGMPQKVLWPDSVQANISTTATYMAAGLGAGGGANYSFTGSGVITGKTYVITVSGTLPASLAVGDIISGGNSPYNSKVSSFSPSAGTITLDSIPPANYTGAFYSVNAQSTNTWVPPAPTITLTPSASGLPPSYTGSYYVTINGRTGDAVSLPSAEVVVPDAKFPNSGVSVTPAADLASGYCYLAQAAGVTPATGGTAGMVVQTAPICTSDVPSSGSPVTLNLTVPVGSNYTQFTVYRYTAPAGGLSKGLLYTCTPTAGTYPACGSSTTDTGAALSGTLPTPNGNNTGYGNLSIAGFGTAAYGIGCAQYMANYDINISVVSGVETAQYNAMCNNSSNVSWGSVYGLRPAETPQPAWAKPMPAFILDNNDHSEFIAESSAQGGMVFHTSPGVKVSDMLATPHNGYSGIANIFLFNNTLGGGGLTSVTTTTAGSGMTPGTYPLVFTAGNCTTIPVATVVVSSDGTADAGPAAVTQTGANCLQTPTVAISSSAGGTGPTFSAILNPSAIVTDANLFDKGNYVGSVRSNIATAAGNDNIGYKIAGQENDVNYYNISGGCVYGTYTCQPMTISSFPGTDGDAESIHELEFFGGALLASPEGTTPALTISSEPNAFYVTGSNVSGTNTITVPVWNNYIVPGLTVNGTGIPADNTSIVISSINPSGLSFTLTSNTTTGGTSLGYQLANSAFTLAFGGVFGIHFENFSAEYQMSNCLVLNDVAQISFTNSLCSFQGNATNAGAGPAVVINSNYVRGLQAGSNTEASNNINLDQTLFQWIPGVNTIQNNAYAGDRLSSVPSINGYGFSGIFHYGQHGGFTNTGASGYNAGEVDSEWPIQRDSLSPEITESAITEVPSTLATNVSGTITNYPSSSALQVQSSEIHGSATTGSPTTWGFQVAPNSTSNGDPGTTATIGVVSTSDTGSHYFKITNPAIVDPVTSDPICNAAAAGTQWYNTTSNVAKYCNGTVAQAFVGDGEASKLEVPISTVVSAPKIAPATTMFTLSGTKTVSNITLPGMSKKIGGCVEFISQAAVPFIKGGNIATAFISTPGVLYRACYFGSSWIIK
jgi:hypothetical protein